MGWGSGEDEDAGRILKVVLALGIFIVTALQRGRDCSGAHDWRRQTRSGLVGLVVILLTLLVAGPLFGFSDHSTTMKRRQQGILTGMPFMANVSTRTFVDDTGRTMYLAKTPRRVISLAPNITEMLFAIGAGPSVVGVTTWCDYPPEASTRKTVGDSRPNPEAILALQPDLVLGFTAIRDDALETLRRLKIPLFTMDVQSVEHVYAHIQTLGRMLERVQEANALVYAMRADIQAIDERVRALPAPRVLYVLYDQPFITVGPGSFIHQLLELAGADNVAKDAGSAWPRLSMEVVLRKNPEILLFPSREGNDAPASDLRQWTRWGTIAAVQNKRLHFVPGTLINRPGPRIVQGLAALARAIHPDVFQEIGP